MMFLLGITLFIISISFVAAAEPAVHYQGGHWRYRDERRANVPLGSNQAAFDTEMERLSGGHRTYWFRERGGSWSAFSGRSGAAIPLAALSVASMTELNNQVELAVTTATTSPPGGGGGAPGGGSPGPTPAPGGGGAPIAAPAEGYTDQVTCLRTFGASGGCYRDAAGKWFPSSATATGTRPGEEGYPPCPGGVTCQYYVDNKGRTTVATACPTGVRCFTQADAVRYQDDAGTHYRVTHFGACTDVAVPGGMECKQVGSGTDVRHFFCARGDAACSRAEASATAGDVAENTKYWTPSSRSDCIEAGGNVVTINGQETGVCRVVGDCPGEDSYLGSSCSESFSDEMEYAEYKDYVRRQVRIKSLQEGIDAGAAWGEMFSFITMGRVRADWVEFGWQSDLKDFLEGNGFGAWLAGRPEYSICYITPDVSDTVGMIMNTGGTGIGMWVKGEFTPVLGRPNETAPTETFDLYLYKITLSVMPSGLTENSGEEDCADRIRFYVRLHGDNGITQEVDFRQPGDPSDNPIDLQCDGPPVTYTGSSAIVWPARQQFNRVCIEFQDSDLHEQISDELEDNNKLCADIVESGSPEDLGCTITMPGPAPNFDCPTATGEQPAGTSAAPAAPEGRGSFPTGNY